MKFLILIALFIISISCTKEITNYSTIDSNNIVRIDFPIQSISTIRFGDTIFSEKSLPIDYFRFLQRFNITDYTKIDSVIYFCTTQEDQYTVDTAFFQLFNMTDNLPIEKSLIAIGNNWNGNINRFSISNTTFSKNIKESLPNKEITIGFRMRWNNNKNNIGLVGPIIYNITMLIYRH